jgi:V/A-type H+/Na+-transporting ATPase subunit F
MQMYLISDNVDTETGMRLAGVEGCVVHKPEEVRDAMDKVLENKDIAIVLITEKLIKLLPEYIYEIKMKRKLPLIVEIPDRHGYGRDANSIMSYVSDAIGLKL